jgi:hypothetical protein
MLMPEFVNTKTGKRYRIIKFDKEAGTITMVGEHGIEFTEPYSKERFSQLGYTLQGA